MKMKIKIPALFLAALLALSAFAGCNSLPPAESPSESASESEALPELSKEELYAVKMRIKLYDEETNFIHCSVTKEGFEQTLDQTKDHPAAFRFRRVFRGKAHRSADEDSFRD